MKIRNGFVSNSSSSSFCILGIPLSDLGIEDLDSAIDIIDCHENLSYESGIETYYEDYVIGINPECIDENKTIKETKQEIANMINESLNVNITPNEISFHTDGGMDN